MHTEHQPDPAVAAQSPASRPRPSSQRGRELVSSVLSAFGLKRPRGSLAASVAASAATAAAAGGAIPPPPPAAESGRLRLAVVGDVHGFWLADREEAALRLLTPHCTLLVGDFGNESVELVRQIASLPLPKAVILGNHDAWYTMTGRSSATARRHAVQQTLSAADLLAAISRGEVTSADQDGVRQQLAALGPTHVGYATMPLHEHGCTVMGARPFSKGGKNFSSIREFMSGLYGVSSMEESAARIMEVASTAPAQHPLVVMGHNGPTGLGSRAQDICGVDWERSEGDHGDPDLQAALSQLHKSGRRVALVTFGHMHHRLNPRCGLPGGQHRLRRMVAFDPASGTVYLNAATVPRVTSAPTSSSGFPSPPPSPPRSPAAPGSLKSFGSGRRAKAKAKLAAAAAAAAAAASPTAGATCGAVDTATASATDPRAATLHHFMVSELEDGEVVSARDVWVQVTPVTEGTAAEVLAAAAAAEAAEAFAGDGSSGVSEGPGPCRIGDYVVQIASEHVVFRTVPGQDGEQAVKFVWNAYDQVYDSYVVQTARRTADAGGAAVGLGGDGDGLDGGEDGGLQSRGPAELGNGAANGAGERQAKMMVVAGSCSERSASESGSGV